MTTKSAAKAAGPGVRYGLVLNLPGAPSTPHHMPDLDGFFHPTEPRPVGGEGEITLEQARALDRDPGVHLALVEIPNDHIITPAADVPDGEE